MSNFESPVIPLSLVNAEKAGTLSVPYPTLYMIVGIVLVIIFGSYIFIWKA
jgi:hypothetical protein